MISSASDSFRSSVFSDEALYLLLELLGKRREILGALEANFSLEGLGQELLTRSSGPLSKDRDVADQPGGDSDEVRARKAIADRRSLSRDGSKKRRVDHKSLRARPDNALDEAPFLALLDELDETVFLELPQVLVHLLARHLEPNGQSSRGVRLDELF